MRPSINFQRPSPKKHSSDMPLCYHCNNIDVLKLKRGDWDVEFYPHHNSFDNLKRSSKTCQLCNLIVVDLEQRDWEYDDPETRSSQYGEIVWYTGHYDTKEDGSRFLLELAIICCGNFAHLDLYADEG